MVDDGIAMVDDGIAMVDDGVATIRRPHRLEGET